MSPRIVLLVTALVASLAIGDQAHAKKKPKPEPCPGGRFVVAGNPLAGPSPEIGTDAIVLAGGMASVDSGCDAAKAKLRRKGKVTLVTAKWRTCAGVKGVQRLSARIDAACRTMKGTVAGKPRRRKFTAALPSPPTLQTPAMEVVPLVGAAIGPDGGTVTVADAGGPLAGLRIDVPVGATTEPLTFVVRWAPITQVAGLPAGATVTTPMIEIEVTGSDTWNLHRMLKRPVKVTLPYQPPATGEETVRFYMLRGDGSLEAMGFESQDLVAHTVTFRTRVFGDTGDPTAFASLAALRTPSPADVVSARRVFAAYVGIGLLGVPDAWRRYGHAIDSGFRPSPNGWYEPNKGSYYKASRGGSCFGFVTLAKYYYRRAFTPLLYRNYHDPADTPTWVDDAVAIEFNARAHAALDDVWDEILTNELDIQRPSSVGVALSVLGALYITGQPVLLGIFQAVPSEEGGEPTLLGGHAISIYRIDIRPAGDAPIGFLTWYVYDPNYPGDATRRMSYAPGDGFAIYESGTTAGSSRFHYNYFQHVSFYIFLSDAILDELKAAADEGFANDSVFPKITIDSIVGTNNHEVVYDRAAGTAIEGTTRQGEHKFVTSDRSVRIRGTVLGGLAQDPCCFTNNMHVLLSNAVYYTYVNNGAGTGDGSFAFDLPIPQGENELVMVADRRDRAFSWWAAFHSDIIESTASPAALTVTLAWEQDQSDVDLYVKEPDEPGGGVAGDTVYFSHRRGESTEHPYLDLDNTRGFGPEHYFARVGTTSLYQGGIPAPDLYGEYTVKVHYYRDHDGDPDNVQPIGYSVAWRYLAFCPDPCASPEDDGYWVDGGASGLLTADGGYGNCCNIDNTGADWSPAYVFDYPKPDPDDYVTVEPKRVMLP